MTVLIIIAAVAMLVSLFGYARLRRAYNGVIGVPGSYFATIGIMLVVYMIIGLFGPKTEVGAGVAEIITTIVVGIIAIGYLVYVMLCKCKTVAQRIFLPIAVVLIAFGWCWRLLGAIFMKIPMEVKMPETQEPDPDEQPVKEVEVWRENGYMKEQLKVSSDGERYYDPEDGEWHKIKK